ncbi:MAG TPA: hypothetical protein VLT33_19830 [Labilithrix sp.]|nr:hypothetical protein [Labilithrix sp.]
MRTLLLSSGAAMIAAATLLHCASNDDEQRTPDAAETGASETSSPADAAPADADADASVVLHDGGDAGGCSPDHWCRVGLPTKDFDLKSVWSFGPDDALAVGDTGMVRWDGKAWSIVPGGDGGFEGLSSLWSGSTNEIWAVGQGQRRLVHGTRSATGAAFTFTTTEVTTGPTRDTITGLAPNDLWLTGLEDDGTPRILHGVAGGDGGAPTFSSVAISAAPFPLTSLSALLVTANDELWLAGTSNAAVVLHARKNGASFVWDQSFTAAGQASNNFGALWGDGPTDVFVLGALTDNFHRTALPDGGGVWGPHPNHSNTVLTSVWGTSKSDVWAVGYLGAIRHWDGATWKLSQIAVDGLPIYEDLIAVRGSSANDVWAVGTGVALHRTGGKP